MLLSLKYLFIPLSIVIVVGCGNEGSSSSSVPIRFLRDSESSISTKNTISPEAITIVPWTQYSEKSVALSGIITYDLVPSVTVQGYDKYNHPVSTEGLNYDKIEKEPSKWVDVRIIAKNGDVLGHTFTDENGSYHFNELPSSTDVKIQVRAKMLRSGTPSWKVEVLDNTKNNALYVMQGDVFSTGEKKNIRRNLHAKSGIAAQKEYDSIWKKTYYHYSGTRAAAPFAILDTIQSAMKKVLSAEKNASFPPLHVFWSKKNTPASGNLKDGHIGTSFYQNRKLYILGDANADTDEYDTHIIAHEWGHYYEDTFSRSDSIGGSHASKDKLDMRLAFSEGWGNAFSAMAMNDRFYVDTLHAGIANGWKMNMESRQTGINEKVDGWFSEASIQHILYDIYDSDSDDPDTVSLGFAPIHEVMTHAQKNTPSFTSIFSFINGIKALKPEFTEQIDALTIDESINPIKDIWGSGNKKDNPYNEIRVDTQNKFSFVYDSQNPRENKLGNHLYYKFTISTPGEYRISVQGGRGTNPDFDLYDQNSSFLKFLNKGNIQRGEKEIKRGYLEEGHYILDIYDEHHNTGEDFTLNITK